MNIKQEVDNNICLNPFIDQQELKSKGILGNMTIYFPKTFSWIQRKM